MAHLDHWPPLLARIKSVHWAGVGKSSTLRLGSIKGVIWVIQKMILGRVLAKRGSERLVVTIAITSVLLLLLASPAIAAAGDLDATFSDDGKVINAIGTGSDIGNAVVQQPDDKLVVAGRCSGSAFDFCVARYNTDGSLDNTFSEDGKVITPIGSGQDWGNAVTTQTVSGETRIVVAGRSHNGSNYDFALARYTSTGALDATFDGDGLKTQDRAATDDMIFGVVAEPDGNITVAGTSAVASQGFNAALAQFSVSGSLNSAFGSSGFTTTNLSGSSRNDVAQEVAVDPTSGMFVIAGYAQTANGNNKIDVAVARYTSLGALNTGAGGFNPSPTNGTGFRTHSFSGKDDFAFDLAIEPASGGPAWANGEIVIAGHQDTGGTEKTNFLVAKFPNNGGAPTTSASLNFGTDGAGQEDYGSSVGIDSQGRILVGGSVRGTSTGSSNFDFGLARYTNATTLTLDTTFSDEPGTNPSDGILHTDMSGASRADYANDLIIQQSDDKVVLAGQCLSSSYDFCVARYVP